MLSGVALAAKSINPDIWVIGAEPKGADDAYRSFTSKAFQPSVNPKTIADGLLTSTGKLTFPLIMKYVDAIHTVTEDEIKYVKALIRQLLYGFAEADIVCQTGHEIFIRTIEAGDRAFSGSPISRCLVLSTIQRRHAVKSSFIKPGILECWGSFQWWEC